MRYRRVKIQGASYFFTVVTHERQPLFRDPQSEQLLANAIAKIREHTIRDEHDFVEHVDYIHYNPVRHGLVAAPRDWLHSTFGQWVDRGVYDPTWGSGEMPELPDWAKRH